MGSNEEDKYMLNPIQAVVAMERPCIVDLLLQSGASMPAVIVGTTEEDVADVERKGMLLRVKVNFYDSRTSKDGASGMSSTQMLP